MFCFSFRKKTAQRRYTDRLKHLLSGLGRPNWNAPENRLIHAGDFGTFDKETGGFVVEGNTYTTDKEFEDSADLAKWRPISSDADVTRATAMTGVVDQKPSVSDGPNVSANLNTRDLLFGAQWRFHTNDGAVFFMYRYIFTYLPENIFSTGLLNKPAFKKKWVVDKVYTCLAHFMYLSDGCETVTARLYQDITNKGDDSGHSPTMSWVLEGCTGTSWCDSQPDASSTPLFNVRLIR